MDDDAATFENETFDKLDLPGADRSHREFTRCVFRQSRLTETSWVDSVFEDCAFEDCDLTGFKPRGATFRNVKFTRCKLLGVEWSVLGAFPDVGFVDCVMRYQTFVGIELPKTRLVRCSIVESTFIDVNLSKSVFDDCDLLGSQLTRCDLTGADFSNSRGVYFDPAANRTKGARVSVETAALMATGLGLKVLGYEDRTVAEVKRVAATPTRRR